MRKIIWSTSEICIKSTEHKLSSVQMAPHSLDSNYGMKMQQTQVSKFYSRGTATPYSCGFSDTTFCLSSLNLAPKQPNKIKQNWLIDFCVKWNTAENKYISFTQIIWFRKVPEETSSWETSWPGLPYSALKNIIRNQLNSLNNCWTILWQTLSQKICNLSSRFCEIPLNSRASWETGSTQGWVKIACKILLGNSNIYLFINSSDSLSKCWSNHQRKVNQKNEK